MATFIIYIIRWGVTLTLLYSLFGLFLKRETLHDMNRVVLLFVLVASMVLPLCQIETRKTTIVTQGREMIEHQIESLASGHSLSGDGNIFAQRQTQVEKETTPLTTRRWAGGEALIAVYLVGLLICWLRFFWSLAMLVKLIRQGKRMEMEGLPRHVRLITHPDVKTPCSWMRWIILSPSDAELVKLPSRSGGAGLLLHELAHIRFGHSWDMLLCEFTCRMLWCVPFAWMLRQDLRDVHEYQADRRVLQGGIKDEEYQLLLIRKATSTGLQPVVNALNQSPIKRRFKMMYRKPSRRWVALKAAYLLPLGALALVAFARPQAMSEIEQNVEEEVTHLVTTTMGALTSSPLPEVQEVVAVETTEAHTPDAVETTALPELPDSNLVVADLADHNAEDEAAFHAIGLAKKQEMEAVLDSVMQAVGASKIREGVYVGNFQPNLNSDTLHIGSVTFLDKQSREMAGLGLPIDEDDPLLYTMTLQEGTRKDEKGYYIRQLAPANTTAMHYEQTSEPKLTPADKLPEDLDEMREPIVIEQHPKETHVIMYWTVKENDAPIDYDFSNFAIVDVDTGDRYLCRSIENFEDKHMKVDVKNRKGSIYQFRFIFPPLDKKVRRVYVGNAKNQYYNPDEIHELADISRKPVRIFR